MQFIGVALLLLGVLAILSPIVSTLLATNIIGFLLIAGGILRFFHGIDNRHEIGIGWLIASAILYVAAGIAILWAPLIGMFSLTLVLGTFFVVGGVSKAIRSYQLRHAGRLGWLVFDAVVTTGLGILLLAGLPMTAFWALGTIVGVDLILGGIVLLGTAPPAKATRST